MWIWVTYVISDNYYLVVYWYSFLTVLLCLIKHCIYQTNTQSEISDPKLCLHINYTHSAGVPRWNVKIPGCCWVSPWWPAAKLHVSEHERMTLPHTHTRARAQRRRWEIIEFDTLHSGGLYEFHPTFWHLARPENILTVILTRNYTWK